MNWIIFIQNIIIVVLSVAATRYYDTYVRKVDISGVINFEYQEDKNFIGSVKFNRDFISIMKRPYVVLKVNVPEELTKLEEKS